MINIRKNIALVVFDSCRYSSSSQLPPNINANLWSNILTSINRYVGNKVDELGWWAISLRNKI